MKALLQCIFLIGEIIKDDLLGFNYHNLPFVSIHSHSCIGEKVIEDVKILSEVIGIHFHKNNIIIIEKKDDDYSSKNCSIKTCSI
jgi:hypothetical protein